MELILAIGILGMLSLGLILTFLSQSRMNKETKESIAATVQATRLLEKLRWFPKNQIPSGPITFDGSTPTPQTVDAFPPEPYPGWTAEGVDYQVRVVVTPFPSGGTAPDLKNVFVEITWPQGRMGMETLCES